MENLIKVEESSFHIKRNNFYFILKINGTRVLAIAYKKNRPKYFEGKNLTLKNLSLLLCPLSSKNAKMIRKIFPQCTPSVVKKSKFIFGFGYRSPFVVGNILQAKIVKKYPAVAPVIAQQSIRELQRTKRTFRDVLDSATWAAFESNIDYWGADADHLKEPKQAKEPAKIGFTHFTIDPSDKIISLKNCNIENEFLKFPKKERDRILKAYNGKPFKIGIDYNFTEDKIKKISVKYRNVFKLVNDFIKVIKKETKKDVGIELSIDETQDITSCEEMIYILQELKTRKIKIDEIAPKFAGYFEKGIDYFSEIKDNEKLKNTKLFERHLALLYKIAKYYKVKLCIHSGSDKFSIYPMIKKITGGDIHIKTAGTFFVEEIRLLAKEKPDEFKKIFNFAKDIFYTEKATYHIITPLKIPDLSKLSGDEIYSLLETKKGNESLRQIIHVSYGKVLTHPEFKKVLEDTVVANEDALFKMFSSHIKKHLQNVI